MFQFPRSNCWLILLMFVLCGCTSKYYVPSAERDFEPIPEFQGSGTISVVNGQPATEPIKWTSRGYHRWYANRKEWTDTAVKIAVRELVKRGLTVQSNDPRSITLSIESAALEESFWSTKMETTVTLRVRTTNGIEKEFKGVSASYAFINIERQVDYAVMDTIVKMLSDSSITEFLRK